MSAPTLPSATVSERSTPPPSHDLVGDPVAVDYAFGFLDISGFTTYCETRGEHAAIEVLTRFRTITRAIAVRRGVRAAKWLGDGVMLVASQQAPLVATVAEVVVRAAATGLHTHAGLAFGPVLLFEGEDYLGRTVNLAARLCDVAGPGELLAAGITDRPDWVLARPAGPLGLAGFGIIDGVDALAVDPAIESWFAPADSVSRSR